MIRTFEFRSETTAFARDPVPSPGPEVPPGTLPPAPPELPSPPSEVPPAVPEIPFAPNEVPRPASPEAPPPRE